MLPNILLSRNVMATASWELTGILPVVWAEALWGKPRSIWGCCVLKEEQRWDSARWRGWCWGWGRRRGRGERGGCGWGRRGWGGGSWPRWSCCSAGWRLTSSTSSASNNLDGVSSVRPPESANNLTKYKSDLLTLLSRLNIPSLFVRIRPFPR